MRSGDLLIMFGYRVLHANVVYCKYYGSKVLTTVLRAECSNAWSLDHVSMHDEIMQVATRKLCNYCYFAYSFLLVIQSSHVIHKRVVSTVAKTMIEYKILCWSFNCLCSVSGQTHYVTKCMTRLECSFNCFTFFSSSTDERHKPAHIELYAERFFLYFHSIKPFRKCKVHTFRGFPPFVSTHFQSFSFVFYD